MLSFAHVLTGNPHTAQDIVQDALERTGLAWRRIRQQDDPEGYVRRVIVRRHLNWVRSLRRERLTDAVPETGYTPADTADDTVWRLLDELPRKQRATLVLRFYLDLSEQQVAELLGCSIGTVKSNSSRGMAKLRAAVGSPAPVGSLS